MSNCVGTYSPAFTDVTIITDVMSHIIGGYAEGTMVTIEPVVDRVTPIQGAKGEEYRAMNPVDSFTMTLFLSQTSHSNDILSQILKNDRDSLDGVFTLSLVDASGTTHFTSSCAYITTEPSQSFSGGGTIESREWNLYFAKPDYHIGGNGRFASNVQSEFESIGGFVDPRWQSSN